MFCLYCSNGEEAAMLYEKGGYFDKAAAVYIRSKNWYVNLKRSVNLVGSWKVKATM